MKINHRSDLPAILSLWLRWHPHSPYKTTNKGSLTFALLGEADRITTSFLRRCSFALTCTISHPGRRHTLKDNGQLFGDCGLHFLGKVSRQTEIGISLSADQQRKGYATETLAAIFGFLFNIMGKQCVFVSTDPNNASTIKLLSALRMRQEAHFLESFWFKDRWADDLIFGIPSREWQTSHTYVTSWLVEPARCSNCEIGTFFQIRQKSL